MKKLVASAICAALVLTMAPLNLVAALKAQPPVGQVAGSAVVEGKPLSNITVRLRNVDTGQLVSSTTTNAQGAFSFSGLPVGNFVVETVALNGTILGTSATISLTAGAMIAGAVTVNTSAAAAAAAGLAGGAAAGAGAAGAGAAAAGAAGAAAGGVGAALGSTLGLITLGAATVGITAGVIATQNDASASQ